jgi:hypothetical protein
MNAMAAFSVDENTVPVTWSIPCMKSLPRLYTTGNGSISISFPAWSRASMVQCTARDAASPHASNDNTRSVG